MRERKKIIVFVITFMSYALYHASRKTLSGVKASITNDWTRNTSTNTSHFNDAFIPTVSEAETFLGLLDALFMAAYAVSLFYWGWLGDRLNPKNVIVFGMVASAVALVSFGSVPKWFDFYSMPYYILTYIVFGLLQACGWPNEVAIMGNWFDDSNRGFIMGLWAACQPVGNIVGSLAIMMILPLGYEYTFAFNSSLMIVGAVVVALTIEDSPQRVSSLSYQAIDQESDEPVSQSHIADQHDNTDNASDNQSNIISDYGEEGAPIGIVEALLLPNVIPYCLCNTCLKFVNYAFFFWLPFYLTGKYGWSERDANVLSIWYDVGGFVGSVVGGMVSDRLGYRSPVIVVMLLASLFILFLYIGIGAWPVLNAIVMTFVGITISGPYNLIVGTICVDLGKQPVLSTNSQAMATVSGLVDGTGSIGSAIGQFIVPIIQTNYGWNNVFYLFIFMNLLAAICLFNRFYLDMNEIRARSRGYAVDADERGRLISHNHSS